MFVLPMQISIRLLTCDVYGAESADPFAKSALGIVEPVLSLYNRLQLYIN